MTTDLLQLTELPATSARAPALKADRPGRWWNIARPVLRTLCASLEGGGPHRPQPPPLAAKIAPAGRSVNGAGGFRAQTGKPENEG